MMRFDSEEDIERKDFHHNLLNNDLVLSGFRQEKN